MLRLATQFHPIFQFLLAMALAAGGLATLPRSITAADMPDTHGSNVIADGEGPDFPDCEVEPPTSTCENLQIFLLIDDSSSMLYTDRQRERYQGVSNVLDILAKEYYLPAVDAQANDPQVNLPNIQVALIHFSSIKPVLYQSSWKTINPPNIAAWIEQRQTFEADLNVKVDYNYSQATDYRTAFRAAAQLADQQPEIPGDCPRLILLFTDGVPNLGDGNLSGRLLDSHMEELANILQASLNRGNDYLFVTTFGLDKSFQRYWLRDHAWRWEALTRDSRDLIPRRVSYVDPGKLASNMEHIIGWAIGAQVNTLTPLPGEPNQYVTTIPALVGSLRLTYYSILKNPSFTLQGPDGKVIQPDGKQVTLTEVDPSIQVLEILDPLPGAYQIVTATEGGLVNQLLRFKNFTPVLALPPEPLLQFTNAQIGIQLLGADERPLAIPARVVIQAKVAQLGRPTEDLTLTPGSDTFTTSWMPFQNGSAAVYICARLIDADGKTITVLHNGLVGDIAIDQVAVQTGVSGPACVPTTKEASLPLQLVNLRSGKPVGIDKPVIWSSDNASSITAVDASAGKYELSFHPMTEGDMSFNVTASVEQAKLFINGSVIFTGIEPPRQLEMTVGQPDTLGDKLSTFLYRAFKPVCVPDNTQVIIGRHLFGWLGPTPVQVNGKYSEIGKEIGEQGIDRFSVQLVGRDGAPSSNVLNSWAAPGTDGSSSLLISSPGLGLYYMTVSDQGEQLECALVNPAPASRPYLLINDFWEYLVYLVPILLLGALVIYLLLRYHKRNFSHDIPLTLSAVVLVAVIVLLGNLIYNHTFKCQLNCGYLIDRTFNSDTLCAQGVGFPGKPYMVIPPVPDRDLYVPILRSPPIPPTIEIVRLPKKSIQLSIEQNLFTLLPRLDVINPSLEVFRQNLARGIIAILALASVVMFLAIRPLLDEKGRRKILIYLGLWLFFFVLIISVFYIVVVRSAP
jgi:hypothetical protein